MLKLFLLLGLLSSPAAASTNYQWKDYPTWGQTVGHHHKMSRKIESKGGGPAVSLSKLHLDIVALRRELAGIREELGRAVPPPVAPAVPFVGLIPPLKAVEKPVEAISEAGGYVPTLPDLNASLPAPKPVLPEVSEYRESMEDVREARLFLIKTATVGYTMSRQTPEVAIGRLHPDFAVKLAAAIRRAREEGLSLAGVYSAYRPPVFGVGGFSDKFNSLHSYGLAADVTGIGRSGSADANKWAKIVAASGLYLPYGPNNAVEWNHTQLLSAKVAAERLRGTITSREPKDLERMWTASGDLHYVLPPAVETVRESGLQ